uniref:Uncharacterized protein LOC111102179 n=1 Tax=Crassostrea virginica TaxID=6565 RepID=A0A8B8AKH7_CRAVI|nr:uncharacterized protein LOC111102179 [Crassostrea virginica]
MSKKPGTNGKNASDKIGVRSRRLSSLCGADPALQRKFDTSLLVGPVYEDNTERKKKAIKQELSDITKRLHQRETYVAKVREKINNIESKDLLLQLADGAGSSITEKEEEELTKSYAETVATFEKLKRIQHQLKANPGKKSLILAQEKKCVGKKVLDNIQLMKTISIQTMKIPTGSTEFVPWKDAATEIVGMMKKVCQESSEEVTALTTKIYQLLDELEKQQLLVRRLNKDLKREKIVKDQLADDCMDLKVQLVQAKETIKRYGTDLESCKKMIEKQLKEMDRRKSIGMDDEEEEDEAEEESRKKLSSIMAQLTGREENALQKMPSDPHILRTQIRQQEGTIAALTQELKETDLKLREFEPRLAAKDVALTELGDEINTMTKQVEDLTSALDVKEKENKKLAAAAKHTASRSVPSCMKCSRVKPAETPSPHVEKKTLVDDSHLLEGLKAKDAELERLAEVIQHFKKLLAETEKKLSEAYGEISALRMLQSEHVIQGKKSSRIETETSSQHASVKIEPIEIQKEDVPMTVETPMDALEFEPVELMEDLPSEDIPLEMEDDGGYVEELDISDKEELDVEMKEEEVVSTAKPVKPRTAVLSVEKEKSQPKRSSRKERTKLPPVIRQQARSSRREPVNVEPSPDPAAKHRRDQVLFQVGDLQSRMNVMLNMVTNFVSTVSRMIYKDPQETKVNGVRAFDFGGHTNASKKKEVDPREVEARQKRAQVLFCGQNISSLLKEVYDLLSTTLNLQHSEFESIYRSFKKHQKRRAIEQAIMTGGLQKYYESGGRNTSYDDHRLRKVGSSLSADDLGQQNVLLYGFHRSKSDLDVHSNISSESFTTQFLRERSQVFLTNTPAETPQGRKTALGHYPASREEVSIAKTTVPKKGLIKLTALDNELKNPLLFEKKEKEVLPMEAVREQQRKQQKYERQRKMLIRRKDIMNQVNIGSLHLAEEKEKHDLEMQIENYTLGDLHRNINELTNTIKNPSLENVRKGGNRMSSSTKSLTPQPRGLALPAINTINLF